MTADPNSLPYLLMEEYKLHRLEAFHQMEAYNRQTTFIQTFGIILFTGAGLIYQTSTPSFLLNLPVAAKVWVFLIGAAVIFYFMSTVMLSSFSLLVLRSRMRKIEALLNAEVKSTIFNYETEISPKFLGSPLISETLLAPVSWSGFWRLILFFGGVYTLATFSVSNLPRLAAIIYSASLFFFSITLVVEYFRLIYFEGPKLISQAETHTGVTRFPIKLAFRYALNFFVVFILFFAVFGSANLISGPLHEAVAAGISFLYGLPREAQMALIAIYVALCAIALPTPSELPLLFMSTVGIYQVFIAAAVGKAFGSVTLALLVRGYIRFNSDKADSFLQLFDNGTIGRWLNSHHGWAAYTLCQAVPFLPMRTSTMVYSAITRRNAFTYLKILASSAFGTVVRMSIMWQLIKLGAAALPFTNGGLL